MNQVENIYWGLVSAYEDVQSKQRALEQSKQLAADNRKQLQIGTMAPLDVVQSDSNVASDQQALVSSQTALEYQQLVMKQAIARNLNDPMLAPRQLFRPIGSRFWRPRKNAPVDDLVKEANANRPDVQQALLALKNDEITLRERGTGCYPRSIFMPSMAATVRRCARAELHDLQCRVPERALHPATTPTIDYAHTFQNLFNNSGPNKGVGLNINIPSRNRKAQSEQARSMLEYRQAQLQAAADLSQGQNAGDQRAICVDQRPRPGGIRPGRRRLQPPKSGRRAKEVSSWGVDHR